PAETLLPDWVSGYAALATGGHDRSSARALVAALPATQRSLALRVESPAAVDRAIAERIAVDAREIGLTIKIDPADTLAPRPDLRLIHITLAATSPDPALAAALTAGCRREFARQGDEVAARVDRMASSDVLKRTAIDLGSPAADRAAFVNEAAPLASAHGLDFLDIVAPDGTIVSSAHWPARFGYKHPWAARAAATNAGGAFLESVDLPRETALGLVAVRRVAAGERRLYVAGGR